MSRRRCRGLRTGARAQGESWRRWFGARCLWALRSCGRRVVRPRPRPFHLSGSAWTAPWRVWRWPAGRGGDTLPAGVRWLHDLGVVDSVGVDVVDTFQIRAARIQDKRVEGTSKSVSHPSNRERRRGARTYLASRACSSIQLSPVTVTLRFFESIALPVGSGRDGALVW